MTTDDGTLYGAIIIIIIIIILSVDIQIDRKLSSARRTARKHR